MNIRVVCILAFSALILCGCCAPAPWSAWRYETSNNFSGYPSPPNLPNPENFSELYVADVFLNVRVMAHNETTNSGDSPYQIIVTATEKTREQRSLIIHSVSVTDSKGGAYSFRPIIVNKAARKIGELNFPVELSLEALNYHNPTPDVKNYKQTALWSDQTLELHPENEAVLSVSVDIEILAEESSRRKVVTHKFMPRKESGVMQCVTA